MIPLAYAQFLGLIASTRRSRGVSAGPEPLRRTSLPTPTLATGTVPVGELHPHGAHTEEPSTARCVDCQAGSSRLRTSTPIMTSSAIVKWSGWMLGIALLIALIAAIGRALGG